MEKYYRASYTSSLDGQTYKDIYVNSSKKLVVGDIILVKSNGGAALCIIREDMGRAVDIPSSSIREFIEIVKGIQFFEGLKKEEKLKELKSQMRAKVKKLEEIAVFEIFAEKDKELKCLLDEYNKLNK